MIARVAFHHAAAVLKPLLLLIDRGQHHLCKSLKVAPVLGALSHVLNAALMSSATPYTFAQAQADRSYWGRLVESTVGAHLCNTATSSEEISYWRESPHEVDFVICDAVRLTAVEVKSGTAIGKLGGLNEFVKRHPRAKRLLVGTGGFDLTEFLSYPLEHWLDFE